MKSFFVLLLALCAGVSIVAESAASTAGGVVDPGIYSALAEGQPVPVVIVFELPEAVRSASIEARSARMAEVARLSDEIVRHAGPGFVPTHRFELVAGIAGRIDRDALERLAAHGKVRAISLDHGGTGHLDVAIPLLGIDDIQQPVAPGWNVDGAGLKVVVLDSGIDASHADFAGALVGEACFCANPNGNCCPNGNATQTGTGAAADDHGHGTWVSGHILGRGAVAPVGAAPGASLVAVKVLDANNSFWSSADITAAFDWVAVHHPDAHVLNASLGTNATWAVECGSQNVAWIDAMRDAVRLVNTNGTLVIASSGNQSITDGIQVPSCLGEVMAIGATWKQDTDGSYFGSCPHPHQDPRLDDVACFSNTSPELELLAPGVLMTASALGGGVISGISGTSFAAPLVAGCATLVRAAHPDLTWEAVRRLLLSSPVRVTDERTGWIHPRLDCLDAIKLVRFHDRFEH